MLEAVLALLQVGGWILVGLMVLGTALLLYGMFAPSRAHKEYVAQVQGARSDARRHVAAKGRVDRRWETISEAAGSLVELVARAAAGEILVVCGTVVRVDEAWGREGALLELADRSGSGSVPVFIPLHLTEKFDLPSPGEFVKVRGQVRKGNHEGLFGLGWLNAQPEALV